MAVFGYGRVSRTSQTTENQKLEIEQAGYKLDYWFNDEGVSGKVPASQRPQFSKLLQQIRDGEQLVVTKIDRLGRDSLDIETTIRLLEQRNIEVVVLQLGKLNLASPAGKMMRTMLSALAEMERDLLIERTQSGLARAKAEGKILGRPSKTTAEQQEAIKAKYASGTSVSELARQYSVSRANILGIVKSA